MESLNRLAIRLEVCDFTNTCWCIEDRGEVKSLCVLSINKY